MAETTLEVWLEDHSDDSAHFLVGAAVLRLIKVRALVESGTWSFDDVLKTYPKGPMPFGGPGWEPCLVRFVKTGEWKPEYSF